MLPGVVLCRARECRYWQLSCPPAGRAVYYLLLWCATRMVSTIHVLRSVACSVGLKLLQGCVGHTGKRFSALGVVPCSMTECVN